MVLFPSKKYIIQNLNPKLIINAVSKNFVTLFLQEALKYLKNK
jgi:hypothetical protein